MAWVFVAFFGSSPASDSQWPQIALLVALTALIGSLEWMKYRVKCEKLRALAKLGTNASGSITSAAQDADD